MLQEYAVEPAAVARSISQAYQILGMFGIEQGRYIAELPRNQWRRLVYQEADDLAPMAKHRLTELLNAARGAKIFPTTRQIDTAGGWVEAILREHEQRPFHAVLLNQETDALRRIISAEEAHGDHRLAEARPSARVPRTPEHLASALLPFARVSSRLAIVDRFFDLRNPNGQDFTGPLRRFLEGLSTFGRAPRIIQIHFHTHDRRPTPDFVAQHAARWVAGVVPAGFSLELFEWRERPGGEDFHDRFLVSDAGAIGIGCGFEATNANEHANMSLFGRAHAAEIEETLSVARGAYDLVHPVMQVNHLGEVS